MGNRATYVRVRKKTYTCLRRRGGFCRTESDCRLHPEHFCDTSNNRTCMANSCVRRTVTMCRVASRLRISALASRSRAFAWRRIKALCPMRSFRPCSKRDDRFEENWERANHRPVTMAAQMHVYTRYSSAFTLDSVYPQNRKILMARC